MFVIFAVLVSFGILTFATKWSADYLGADRTDYGWCALSIVVAGVLSGIGTRLPFGGLAALLLSAAAYKFVLQTTLWKGFCIIVIQAVLGGILAWAIGGVLGSLFR
ncbi:MAG: hypothetical protein ABI782_10930 [Anaerolineaceae bacterium]